jgi:hypothetical protein
MKRNQLKGRKDALSVLLSQWSSLSFAIVTFKKLISYHLIFGKFSPKADPPSYQREDTVLVAGDLLRVGDTPGRVNLKLAMYLALADSRAALFLLAIKYVRV